MNLSELDPLVFGQQIEWEQSLFARYNRSDEGSLRYLEESRKDFKKTQEALHVLLKDPKYREFYPSIYHFLVGSYFTFNLIERDSVEQELLPEELESFRRSIDESITSIGKPSCIDLGWAVDKIEKFEPDYGKWLDSASSGIENPDGYNSFCFGAILTILPFVQRNEARLLTANFYSGDPTY